MRVALLSLIEPSADGTNHPRALLSVGGITVARHQLALALALGCERVICLTASQDGEITTLQHAAERAGALFHRVAGLHGLLALVAANDEVIALGDGLLAWPEAAIAVMGGGPVVLVQPVEVGLPQGFERLDLNHASAAALRVPGRLIEQMSGFPADCDVFATLQRVALQAHVPQHLLPPQAEGLARWSLVRSDAEAHAMEPTWIALHTGLPPHPSPTERLAAMTVRWVGPALLHAGTRGRVVAMAAGVLCLLALMLGWFRFPALGLACCAMAWLWFESAVLVGRIERNALRLPQPRVPAAITYGWIMDATLLLLLTWSQAMTVPEGPAPALWNRAFAPLMLLGLVRLVPRLLTGTLVAWASWIQDRGLLALLLMAVAWSGLLGGGVGVLALGLVICGIICTDRPSWLTGD